MIKHAFFKCGVYVLTVFWVFSFCLDAAAKTISLGSATGNYDDVVALPVMVDDPSGIGGFSFTLSYDPKILTFVGIEQGEMPVSNGTAFKGASATMVDGHSYFNPYIAQSPYADVAYDKTSTSTFFYTVNHDKVHGQLMIAGVAEEQPTGTSLFKTRFKVNSASGLEGDSTVRINKTIIKNDGAGYAGNTFLPLLTGLPATTPDSGGYYPTPVFDASLGNGVVTVHATQDFMHTIAGVARYGSNQGVGATRSSIELLRKGAGGGYITENTQILGNDGAFAFSDMKDGLYAVRARSGNPLYYDSETTSFAVNGTDVVNLSLVLQQPFRFSGKVLVGSETDPKTIAGIRIVVRNGNGMIVGIYGISDTGSFNCASLPPGDYTVEAVYGGESVLLAQGDNYWELELRSISGSVAGLDPGENVMISTVSPTAGLQKAILRTMGNNGNGTYLVNDLLAADDVIVSGTASGMPTVYYDNATDFTEADPVDISQGNASGINLDFTPFKVDTYAVSGAVTNDDIPVGSENVYAYNVNTRAMIGTSSDVDGTFSFSLVPGTYEISVIKQNGHVFYYAGNATSRDRNTAVEITLVDSARTDVGIDVFECSLGVHGLVTYQGDPLARALIIAQGSDGVRLSAVTNTLGTYDLVGLCDGVEYTLRMVPPSSSMPVQTSVITAHEGIFLNFSLEPFNTVQGIVRDSISSLPVTGATVYLVDKRTGILVGERMVKSGADGRFNISGIENGLYVLVISHPLYRSNSMELSVQGDVEPEVVLIKGAFIYGTVSSGDPVSGATVVVSGGTTPLYDRTDTDGGFKIYGLDHGKVYTVTVLKTGYTRAVMNNVNATLDGTEVPFILTKPLETYVVAGEIRSGCANATMANTQVILSSNANNYVAVKTSNAAGAYRFDDVPNGSDFSLIVNPSGAGFQQYVERNIIIASDIPVRNITLPCGTDSEIKGQVKWAGGSDCYVFLYTDNTTFVDYIALGNLGSKEYVFTGLRSDLKYYVLAVAAGNIPEWYDGAASGDTAAVVLADTAGVDITLEAQ